MLNNPTWSLMSITKNSTFDSDRFIHFIASNKYPAFAEDIIYSLILKRNPLYIMINGIFPNFIMNCVILSAFGLPFAPQMTITMTSFLTLSVNSLRIAGDIPVQSEYLPLITLYNLLSIFYAFLGLLWFILGIML